MIFVIAFIFSGIITQVFQILAFGKLINQKIKWTYKLSLLIILVSIILFVVNKYLFPTISVIISIVYFFLLYKKIFNKSWRKTIFYGIFIWIIGVLLDILAMTSISVINNYIDISSDYELLFKAIPTLIMQFIILSLFSCKKVSTFFNKIYKKLEKINISYIRIFCITIIFIGIGTICFLNIYNMQYNLIILLIGILITIGIFNYINKEYQITTMKETNNLLIKNNEFYIKLINDYKVLKHNITHELLGVKTVANKKSKILIDDIIQKYNSTFQTTQDICEIPVGINGLIYEKLYNFGNKNIHVAVNNNVKSNFFKNLKPRCYNLMCESLGILLDNALEASEKSKEKVIMIDIRENDKEYNIKVINTFSDLLDIDKLGTINYTTKENGHGVGLFSLIGRKKIKIKNSIINCLFQSEIIIQKISK